MAPRRILAFATIAAAVAAGLAVLAWALFLRDTTSPVSVGAAVPSFRAERPTGSRAAGFGPAEGVYVYRTTGYEKTDALTGSRHGYPARTTIEVRAAGCGFVMRWQPLRGRSSSWEI